MFDANLLEREPDKPHQIKISPQEIGGELLSILSKGLYTNPMDCIREYVQNAVDANAKKVTISLTANSVTVFDDGVGMNFNELKQARLFGLSPKSILTNVGFRGIGIYSGFDICKRLVITSKKAGEKYSHSLIFHFLEMKQQLEEDKQKENIENKVSLIDLLSNATFAQLNSQTLDSGTHFTQITLYDLEDTHVRHLSNRKALKAYLLENVPIDFDDNFEYKQVINDALYQNVPNYNAVQIELKTDGLEDEIVMKTAIPQLREPIFETVRDENRRPIAFYWTCINKNRTKVSNNFSIKQGQPFTNFNVSKDADGEKGNMYDGLVYKVKGFTIGNRDKLRSFFGRSQVYPWVTGEVYVLDPNVIPNAERNDFETNHARRTLEYALLESLKEKVESKVLTYQEVGVANERVDEAKEELEELRQRFIDNSQADDLEFYSRLDQVRIKLSKHKNKASSEQKKLATGLLSEIAKMKDSIKSQANQSTESQRRKKSGKRDNKSSYAIPLIEPLPEQPLKTLLEILTEAGWELEGDTAYLVEIFQSSLNEVVGNNKQVYTAILEDFEAKINQE